MQYWYHLLEYPLESMKIDIRLAEFKDLSSIMDIIFDAQKFLMLQQIPQWQGMNCPSENIIINDIQQHFGYVLVLDDEVKGYASFSSHVETLYDELYDSLNLSYDQYIIIYRIAAKHEIRGTNLMKTMIQKVMDELSKSIKDFRVDTHPLNRLMQRFLQKLDFVYIGDITLPIEEGYRYTFRKVY